MPRQNRRRRDEPTERAPLTSLGQRRASWRGRDYLVRSVTGPTSGKSYRCPGCDQELTGGNHVVAWPAGDADASDRRHWHTACWAARESRQPGVLRKPIRAALLSRRRPTEPTAPY